MTVVFYRNVTSITTTIPQSGLIVFENTLAVSHTFLHAFEPIFHSDLSTLNTRILNASMLLPVTKYFVQFIVDFRKLNAK